MTQPSTGAKTDYVGQPVWAYAATGDDKARLQLAWAEAMHTTLPVPFQVTSKKGTWSAKFQRIDDAPVIACEYVAVVANPLAHRELEIARLFSLDWKPGEIAGKLGISPHTVETVRQRILAKLQVRGVAGITKWLLRAGLIEL